MVNKVILVGNVGREPQFKDGQTQVCNFSIATSRRWKDSNGQSQEETEWHNVVTFGRTAQFVNNYVTKGRALYVEGRLHTRKIQGKDGTDKFYTDIVAENVQLIGGRDQADRGEPARQKQPARSDYKNDASGLDEDIPF